MGYSRGIHGVFICIGYVTEEKSSEGVNKEDNESNKHPCAGAQKSKLSKPQAGIFINNKNNLDSTMETMINKDSILQK